MPNKDAPSGLHPVRHLNGSPWNGKTERYFIPATDSTAVFVGDPVSLAGSADADGVPTVKQAVVGGLVCGVVVGVAYNPSDLTDNYRAASTARYVDVCDATDVIFELQEDSDGGALAATDVGSNADFIVGSGSTTTGNSGVELDSSSVANVGTEDLQIMRLVKREDNAIGTNAKWEVRLNNHQYSNQVAGL